MTSEGGGVFISGPMSGIPNYNRDAFNEAEKMLKKAGYSVFNPAWLQLDEKLWGSKEIARIDISALSSFDYIFQIDGWDLSLGAKAEAAVAKWMGIEVLEKSTVRKILRDMESDKNAEMFREYLEGDRSKASVIRGYRSSRTEHLFW